MYFYQFLLIACDFPHGFFAEVYGKLAQGGQG
jgi:hypothetical protein